MRCLVLALLFVLVAHALPAQWRIAITHGLGSGYGDATRTDDPDHPEFHPDRLRAWDVALSRELARWRVGVAIRRGRADLAEDSDESAVLVRNALTDWSAFVDLSRRIVACIAGPSLRVGAGAGLDRWSFDLDGDIPRWRPGARVLAEVDIPIAGHWSGLVRAEYAIGKSAFGADALPEGFVAHAGQRAALFVGVAAGW